MGTISQSHVENTLSKLRNTPHILIAADGVEILRISAPPPLELGSLNEIVLDCDYDLREDERGQLEIKWYFNKNPAPFLQWIPGGGRRPQLISPNPFDGHVDLNYKYYTYHVNQCRVRRW